MSKSDTPENLLGRLIRPTIGVETRQVIQRREDIALVNARTLGRLPKGSEDDIAVAHRATKVRFSSPEVTASVSPEYHDAREEAARVVAKSPAKGLNRSFGSFADLLFPPRRQTPTRHQPSPSGSLVWDDFPKHSTPGGATSAESSDADDDAAPWPPFSPAFGPNLRQTASPSPEPLVRRYPPPPPARIAFDLSNDSGIPANAAAGEVLPPARLALHTPVIVRQPQASPPQIGAPAAQPPAGLLNPVDAAPPRQEPPLQQGGDLAAPPPARQPVPPAVEQQPAADPALPAPPGQLPNAQPVAPPGQAAPAIAEQAVDADLDDDPDPPFTMTSALIPPPFRGSYQEDGQEWLETVSWYVSTQRTPNERSKIALVGLLLLDDAKRWFLQQTVVEPPADNGARPDGAIATFQQFKDAFLRRFQRGQADLWREQALIWQHKQKPGQSTQSYLNELQDIAGRARATPEQVLTAAISGLADDVKTFCLSHELANIQDLLR